MLIDSHCHLTSEGLFELCAEVIARAVAAGVSRLVSIGTHPEDHARVIQLIRTFPPVFGALGIHPHHAADVAPGYEALLENLLQNEPKLLALGECGLDYHYDFAPKLLQQGVLLNQLEIARRHNFPVILHVRQAHADALAILRDFPELRCVVHCFTGSPAECRQWLDRGAYIGITGIVTYKNAADVQASAQLIPEDRLLIETDAPYLSPEPVRKLKPNQPAHLLHTAQFLATLRGTNFDTLCQQTTENVARLFGQKLLAV